MKQKDLYEEGELFILSLKLYGVNKLSLKQFEKIINSNKINKNTFNHVNFTGHNALMTACYEGLFDCVKLLLNCKFMNQKFFEQSDDIGVNAFFISVLLNNNQIVHYLYNSNWMNEKVFHQTSVYNTNVFMMACHNGNLELVKLFVNSKYSNSSFFNITDDDNDNAFTSACKSNNFELIDYLLNSNILFYDTISKIYNHFFEVPSSPILNRCKKDFRFDKFLGNKLNERLIFICSNGLVDELKKLLNESKRFKNKW